MRTANKILGILALVLFVGAGLAWERSQRIIHQYRWIVLEEPIRLEDGFSISHPFTVDVATKYWIEVECRKTVPFETLDHALNKNLAVEFAVSSGRDRIAFGDSSEDIGAGYTDYSISRSITTFDAAPGVSYVLAFRVMASLPELALTRPVVKVCIDHLVFKNAFVTASLSAYLAVALAVIGLVCALVFLGSLLFRRRNDKSRNS